MQKRHYGWVALLVSALLLNGCGAFMAGTAATGVVVAQDRRTAGTIVEDSSIELKATKAVLELGLDPTLNHINVVSYNNDVLLLGQVPEAATRIRVEETVQGIEKVRNLYNEIQLAAPTSIMTRSSDAWITGKIKSEMLLSKAINPTRVKVLTEDGVVYLLGIVSPDEEELSVKIARHTSGVKRVIKIFEPVGSIDT